MNLADPVRARRDIVTGVGDVAVPAGTPGVVLRMLKAEERFFGVAIVRFANNVTACVTDEDVEREPAACRRGTALPVMSDAVTPEDVWLDAIVELVRRHQLGYINDPGGAEFYRDGLGRLRVWPEAGEKDVYERLIAWLRENGVEP